MTEYIADQPRRRCTHHFAGCPNPAAEPHECPYQVEIKDDHELCECCPACERECRMDI